MKIKIATTLEGLRTAMERGVEAQMTHAVASITSALRNTETTALVDAVEQQIEVWETERA